MKKIKQKLCKDCINFIRETDKIYSCDYEYWENIKVKDAIIFVPELFDCDKWESYREFLKKC
jgi:hypothetical protein